MSESVVSSHFGSPHAATYDERSSQFAPIRDALDFLTRMVLQDMPKDARILCVGAGTGAETIMLAKAFPYWRFTAVEPSSAMLDVFRRKAEEAGISSRCDFHEGYLDTLRREEPFEAATSILVSQFLTDQGQRRDFFRQIAKRLRPGAYLINADLASSTGLVNAETMYDVWLRTRGMAAGSSKPSDMGWGKIVSVSTCKEVEALITAGGFDGPTLFYQALFIHAWFAKLNYNEPT